MGRPERALYASIRRLIHRFNIESIPFTGPAGSDLVCWNLNPRSTVLNWFRAAPTLLQNNTTKTTGLGLEQGLKLLDTLENQLSVLTNCEEETREDLAEWAALARSFQHPPKTMAHDYSSIAACEAGMDLLTKQIAKYTDPLGIISDSEQENGGESITIEQLVQTVSARQSPLLSTTADHLARLRCLLDIIYKEFKFKYESFEWVYEGLDPLLSSKVLEKKLSGGKATPAALALITATVARHCPGLISSTTRDPLLPFPAASIEAGAAQDPNTVAMNSATAKAVEHLPPEIALRVSSTTQAAAPGPGTWLLLINDGKNDGGCRYIDAGTGTIVDAAFVKHHYPCIANLSAEEWKTRTVLGTWQGLCRIAMQAHQRRGESDLVAHWMYISLALDPGAPEWVRALAGTDIASAET